MHRFAAILLVLLVSFSAFAADPRIEVRPLPPAGVSEQDAAAMEEAARLLGRSISQDVMIGGAGPLLAAKAEACAGARLASRHSNRRLSVGNACPSRKHTDGLAAR